MSSATRWIKRNMIEHKYGVRTTIKKLRKAKERKKKVEQERKLLEESKLQT